MGLLDFLFPPHCLGCRARDTYLCSTCIDSFRVCPNQICPVCTKGSAGGLTHPHCRSPHSLDGLTSTFTYQGITKISITKLKYQFIHSLTTTLTDLLISFTDFTPLQPYSWTIVPVPLHPRRLKWRGFNQAELLGQALSRYTHWPYLPHLLSRTHYTTPQMSLSRSSRLTNLHGAFAVHQSLDPKAYPLLLVDDVWTTGSTLTECAKVLKQAGATKVWALTLARVTSR